MTDGAAALLTAVDFVAPAVVIWLFVLRRSESLLSSFLAIAGLSAFLVPSLTFLLNRTIGYPLDRLGLTGLAAVLVLGSIAWSKVILPRLGPLRKQGGRRSGPPATPGRRRPTPGRPRRSGGC